MRRVARRQVILLFEPTMSDQLWLFDYFPESRSLPSEVSVPRVEKVRDYLNVQFVPPLLIPADCTDGFAGAYWRRPEAYLDPAARDGISSQAQLSPEAAARGVSRLEQDITSGRWDSHYGFLRSLPEYDLGYRLVIAG